MAISKANFNSFNVTPTASKFITFNSSNNGLAADDIGGNLKLINKVSWSFDGCILISLKIYSLYVESNPEVKDIVELLLAVCVDIKFKAPPLIAAGIEVIADKELLLQKFKAIRLLHIMLLCQHLRYLN